MGKAETFVDNEVETAILFEPVRLGDHDDPSRSGDDAARAAINATSNSTGVPNATIPDYVTKDKAILGALFAPAGAVADNDTMLIAGVLSDDEINSGKESGTDRDDIADPAKAVENDELGGKNNFRYGNYSFSIRAYERDEATGERKPVENFTFAKPIRISVYYDVEKLLGGRNSQADDEFAAKAQPVLTFYSTLKKRWMAAADSCDPPNVVIDEARSQMHVDVCHLTQFAVFFQAKPKARVSAKRHVVFWPSTEVALDGSGSDDPDGDKVEFLWSVVQSNLNTTDSVAASSAALPVPTLSTPRASTTRVTGLAPGTHTLRLRVTDGDGGFDEATVSVLVLPRSASVSASPLLAGRLAQPDQSIASWALDGRAIAYFWLVTWDYAASQQRPLGTLTAAWRVAQQPAANSGAARLSDASALDAQVVGIEAVGTYRFALRAAFAHPDAHEPDDTYAADTVVHALATLQSHKRPVVRAVAVTSAVVPYSVAEVMLDGSGTYDPSGLDAALRYRWEVVGAASLAAQRRVAIVNATARVAHATGLSPGGMFTFQLTATDTLNVSSSARTVARVCRATEAGGSAGSYVVLRSRVTRNPDTGAWDHVEVTECARCEQCNPVDAWYQDCDGVKPRRCRAGARAPNATGGAGNGTDSSLLGFEEASVKYSYFEDPNMRMFAAFGVLTLVTFLLVLRRRRTKLRKRAAEHDEWHGSLRKRVKEHDRGVGGVREHHDHGAKIMTTARVVCISCGHKPPAGALPAKPPAWRSGHNMDSVAWVCQHIRKDGHPCGQHNAVMPVEARHHDHGMGRSLARGWAYFPELRRDPANYRNAPLTDTQQAGGASLPVAKAGGQTYTSKHVAANPLLETFDSLHRTASDAADNMRAGPKMAALSAARAQSEKRKRELLAHQQQEAGLDGAFDSTTFNADRTSFAAHNPMLARDELLDTSVFARKQRERLAVAKNERVAQGARRARPSLRGMGGSLRDLLRGGSSSSTAAPRLSPGGRGSGASSASAAPASRGGGSPAPADAAAPRGGNMNIWTESQVSLRGRPESGKDTEVAHL